MTQHTSGLKYSTCLLISHSAGIFSSSALFFYIKVKVKSVSRSQIKTVPSFQGVLWYLFLVCETNFQVCLRLPKLYPDLPAFPAVIQAALGLHTSYTIYTGPMNLQSPFYEAVFLVCHLNNFFIFSRSLPSFHHIREDIRIVQTSPWNWSIHLLTNYLTVSILLLLYFCLPLEYNFIKVHI